MSIESRKKDIGGHTYTVYQLSAKEGRKVLTRLVRLAGPGLAAAAAASDEGGAKLWAGIAGLCNGLNDDDMEFLCDTLGKHTTVLFAETGKAPRLSEIFDLHFAGKYLEMCQWLAFALQVNFASFFDGATASGLLAGMAAGASQSASRPTSTGSSGES